LSRSSRKTMTRSLKRRSRRTPSGHMCSRRAARLRCGRTRPVSRALLFLLRPSTSEKAARSSFNSSTAIGPNCVLQVRVDSQIRVDSRALSVRHVLTRLNVALHVSIWSDLSVRGPKCVGRNNQSQDLAPARVQGFTWAHFFGLESPEKIFTDIVKSHLVIPQGMTTRCLERAVSWLNSWCVFFQRSAVSH